MFDYTPNSRRDFLLWQFYTTLRLLISAPLTPPYFLLLFALSQITSACIYYFSLPDYAACPIVAALVRILFSASFVYLAGLLPLQAVRPAPNVARSTDVRLSNYPLHLLSDTEIRPHHPISHLPKMTQTFGHGVPCHS